MHRHPSVARVETNSLFSKSARTKEMLVWFVPCRIGLTAYSMTLSRGPNAAFLGWSYYLQLFRLPRVLSSSVAPLWLATRGDTDITSLIFSCEKSLLVQSPRLLVDGYHREIRAMIQALFLFTKRVSATSRSTLHVVSQPSLPLFLFQMAKYVHMYMNDILKRQRKKKVV